MATSRFDLIEVQEIQYQLDVVEENVEHLRAVHHKSRNIHPRDQKDNTVMRAFYEKNYRTLLSLCNQYERQIKLLEKLNLKRMDLESKQGQHHGMKQGVILGVFVGIAICVPLGLYLHAGAG